MPVNCVVCGIGFREARSFYKHLRNAHAWNEEQVMGEKIRIKTAKHTEVVSCDQCNKVFSTRFGLQKHKKQVHGIASALELNVTCPVCSARFHSHRELAHHCGASHRDENADLQDFSVFSGNFSSIELFEAWKTSLETSTCTTFSKRDCKERSNGRKHIYWCRHARGHGAGIDAEEVRHVYGKSKRVHSHCPAYLKVFEKNDGSVVYEGCTGHLGHIVSAAYLRLSTEDEKDILNMLKLGMEASSIVQKLERQNWNYKLGLNEQRRICYIENKDVWRLAERNGLIQGRSHSVDLVSMEELLHREDVAAFEYVKSGHPTGDGFVLALVTTSGKKYLDRHGYRGLVFDDTFNVSRYSFRLATLLVSDDGGHGFPCGFVLSFRMTSQEISTLFRIIKNLLPQFDTQFVMTDDCGVFYNGFMDVFPLSRAQKILCKFHLSQSIGRKLKETLKREDVKIGTALFSQLLDESEPSQFERMYVAFLSWIGSRKRRNAIAQHHCRTKFLSWSRARGESHRNQSLETIYSVTINESCDCDPLNNSHCQRCGACAFRMTCSCRDSMNPGVACIHCHAVATFSDSAKCLLPVNEHRLASSGCSSAKLSRSTTPGSHGNLSNLPNSLADDDVLERSISSQEAIAEQDCIKEDYQRCQGNLAYVNELLRVCMKKKLLQPIREANNALMDIATKLMEVTGSGGDLVRRVSMQPPGRKPKPEPIEKFKTRAQTRRRKRGRTS
ncbi:zinc finger, C2H2 type [Cooperia oncophora]